MTQIVEFTKHSCNYLIHHFEFECNGKIAIGPFLGNCSLNKFMSLNDWHNILNDLNGAVESYVENPLVKPDSAVHVIGDTSFELNISWIDVDEAFYSKLLQNLDFRLVFPFVIKVNVTIRTNVDKFSAAEPILTPIVPKKKTIDKSVVVITTPQDSSIKLKECCVRLPLLKFDENGDVIQKEIVRNKRKHSALVEDDNTSTPCFMSFKTSTPFVPNGDVALDQSKNEVTLTFNEKIRKVPHRLTTTPRSSNERKTGTQFHPRIRLLNLPDNLTDAKKAPRKNGEKMHTAKTGKKTKSKLAASRSVKKHPKSKINLDANETELFVTPPIIRKAKKTATDNPTVLEHGTLIKKEERNLNALTEAEIWASFDDHYSVLSTLFHDYLKQTDAIVRKPSEYNHFDMISLLTTDQFSVMLDIVFEKFVKIGEFGNISYDTLFFELIIPEWVLAIFMRRKSLDRDSAVRTINAQKSSANQSYEGYTSIVTHKLDDSIYHSQTRAIIID